MAASRARRRGLLQFSTVQIEQLQGPFFSALRIRDPKVAEKLIPITYGFGTKRMPLEAFRILAMLVSRKHPFVGRRHELPKSRNLQREIALQFARQTIAERVRASNRRAWCY